MKPAISKYQSLDRPVVSKRLNEWLNVCRKRLARVYLKAEFIKRMRLKKESMATFRPSDVFLVGHPKSGNTWVAFMVASILSKFHNKKLTMANVHDFVPNLHMPGLGIKDFDHFPDPRIFRNENPVWRDYYPKTIYLVRDPRAVYLSYYHHWLHTERDDYGTLEEFVDELLEHGCIRRFEAWLDRWDVQVEDWLARAERQPVKIVRYEDLIEKRERKFREIVDFVKFDCSESLILSAVDRGSFKNMRKSEETYGAEAFPGQKGERGYFMRKGQIDSWKEEMPKNVSTKIEKKFRTSMEAFGYL